MRAFLDLRCNDCRFRKQITDTPQQKRMYPPAPLKRIAADEKTSQTPGHRWCRQNAGGLEYLRHNGLACPQQKGEQHAPSGKAFLNYDIPLPSLNSAKMALNLRKFALQ